VRLEAPSIAFAVQRSAARSLLFRISIRASAEAGSGDGGLDGTGVIALGDHPALSVQVRFKRDGAVWPQVKDCDFPAPVLANRAASAPQSRRMSTPSRFSR